MIDTVVRATLKSIFSDRVYPDTFLQRNGSLGQLPACRYTRISGDNSATVCGTDDESTDDTRVQIDIVAGNYAERESLVAQVITAMQTTDPPCYREGGVRREFDEPTRNYRASIDFIFTPSTEVSS